MSRVAVRKERLGGTGFGRAYQAEHWAWTDRSKMADGLRCAERVQRRWAGFRGTGLAGIRWKAMGSEMRSRLGKEALTKEALVKDALAKEALARRPLVRKMMHDQRERCLQEKRWPERN